MAFFDFLSKDIGGYTGVVNDPGGLGIHNNTVPRTGITWSDFIQAAANRSKMQYQPFQPLHISQQDLNNVYQLPGINQQQQKQKSGLSDVMDIASVLGSFYGFGV